MMVFVQQQQNFTRVINRILPIVPSVINRILPAICICDDEDLRIKRNGYNRIVPKQQLKFSLPRDYEQLEQMPLIALPLRPRRPPSQGFRSCTNENPWDGGRRGRSRGGRAICWCLNR